MTKLRLRWHRITGVGTTIYRFGALTTAGSGAVPVTGSSITSGDGAGHWQIGLGYLSPSATGVAAGLNLGPYALVLDDGSHYTVNIDANAWDVRTQSEWDTIIAQATAALTGKTIYIRPDSYRPSAAAITTGVDGTAARLRRADYAGLTIEGRTAAINSSVYPPVRSADPCTVDKFLLRGARNITFRKLATTRVAENKFKLTTEAANACYGIVVDQCHISGAVGDPQGDYSISTNYPNYGIDLVTYSNAGTNNAGGITFTNNAIEWGDALFSTYADRLTDNTVTITGNFFRYAYSDCNKVAGGLLSAVTVNCFDNIMTDRIGKASDSADPHGDAFQFGGTTSTAFDITINFERNRILAGTARGDTMQGLFLSDLTSSDGSVDSGHFYIVTAIGNLYVGDNVAAMTIDQAKSCTIKNNTIVDKVTTPTSVNTPTIAVGARTSSGTHTITGNAADAISYSGTVTASNNVVLGRQGSTIPYSTAFVGPTFENISTPATALTTYSPKSGGPLDSGSPKAGSVNSGAVSFPSTIPGNDGVTF